jgi:hypothetical protein
MSTRAGALALGLGLGLGCGGSGSAGGEAAQPSQAAPDFSLSLASPTLAITAGQSGSLAVTVSRSGGFSGPVSLSGLNLPPGITVSESGEGRQLTLQVDPSVPGQTYSGIVVQGQSGPIVRTVSLALDVVSSAAAVAAAPLPASSIQAPGGVQGGGSFLNEGVAQQPYAAITQSAANGSEVVRDGYLPALP